MASAAVGYVAIKLATLIEAATASMLTITATVDSAIAREGERLDKAIAREGSRLDRRIGSVSSETVPIIRGFATDLSGVAEFTKSEVRQLRVDVTGIMQTRTGELTAQTQALANAYSAIPGDVRASLAPYVDCDANGLCWQGQVSDILFAGRRMFRETATAMPQLVDASKRMADNSAQTTEASARAMNNLAETFKPLPRWVRIPLAIVPAIAQTALPFSIGALTTK